MTSEYPNRFTTLLYRSKLWLLVLGILVYIASIYLSRYEWADNLGLFSGLSWTFYLSISILLLVFYLSVTGTRSVSVAFSAVLLIQVFFSLVGYLIGGSGASQPNYVGEVGYFDGTNFVLHNSISALIPHSAAYGGWPAPLALYAALISVTNTSSLVQPVLIVSQISYSVFDSILVFLIARQVFGKDGIQALLVALLYAFGGHYIPAVLDDIGLSYTILFLIILVLLSPKLRNTNQIVVACLYFAVALSNFYASIMLGAILIAHGLYTRRYRFPLLYLMILLIWLIFGFPFLFTGLVQNFLAAVFKANILFGQLTAASTIGSSAHHVITSSTVAEDTIFAAMALLVLFWSLIKRLELRKQILEFGAYIVSMGIVTVIAGPTFGGNPIEALERVYFVSFPFFLLIIVFGMRKELLPIVLLMLVVIAPLSMITMYGPVVPTYLSTAQQYGGTYLEGHLGNATSYFKGYVGNHQLYSLVPTYYNINSPAINEYYFVNPNVVFQSSYIAVNSSQLINSLATHSGGIYSIGNSTAVYVSAYTGSLQSYYSAINALNRTDLVYSNPDLAFYYGQ